jgi:hypothetical protein
MTANNRVSLLGMLTLAILAAGNYACPSGSAIGPWGSRKKTKQHQRRISMKRTFSALLALAVAATLVVLMTTSKSKHGVPVVYAQSGCSVATLTGNYAFSNPGFTTPNKSISGSEDPFAAVGVLT